MGLFVDPKEEESFYILLEEQLGCGPFDGGCVAVAFALQKYLQCGSVAVITGHWDHQEPVENAQHAFVYLSTEDVRFLEGSEFSEQKGRVDVQEEKQPEFKALMASAKGFFLDGNGLKGLEEGVHHFNEQECFGKLKKLSVRLFVEGDLSDCEKSSEQVDALCDFFAKSEMSVRQEKKGAQVRPFKR